MKHICQTSANSVITVIIYVGFVNWIADVYIRSVTSYLKLM